MKYLLFFAAFFVQHMEVAGQNTPLAKDTIPPRTFSLPDITPPGAGAVEYIKPAPGTPITTIAYATPFHDFGKARQGQIVKYTFHFSNTGKSPLIILNAHASCGCTIPSWPKDTIAPGAEGDIMVEFNTANKAGRQLKRVTVVANTDPAESYLDLAGEVLVPKKKKRNQ